MCPRPRPSRKMITKESASKQVTSLHSTIRVQVRWGENWGWGQIFPHNAAAEIFYRNRTSGVLAVAADGAIMADKCSNFWPSQGCSVKICQNMLSEHSYRGLLLRSLSSRSDWTHGADRGHHILLLQTTEHAEIANYSKYFDNNVYNFWFHMTFYCQKLMRCMSW